MELLEKAYKTNEFGIIVEEITVNEVFKTWEEFKARADEFEGYLILANHNSKVNGRYATTRKGSLVAINNLTDRTLAEYNKDSIVKKLAKKLGKIETVELVERERHNPMLERQNDRYDMLVNNNVQVLISEASTYKNPTRLYVEYRRRGTDGKLNLSKCFCFVA